ncbi:hypothetical protein GCM10025867_47530 (plasmid) [Frondihabitans sucicola]|uniref:Helicase ATP-binding domain-containing protein n=1 Tax=Frondihabitans sucicola TaxID=1268041 RepID=A0ABN6Y5A3_9MICO|nr:DEAD/DEAH box helicase [Frondihabitans sucicola]BDZ52512.1 hypothetical protein GCM10025867_47530 [Frondihabitans sucicola]
MTNATTTTLRAWATKGEVFLQGPRSMPDNEVRALGFASKLKGSWRLNPEAAPRVIAFAQRHGGTVNDELSTLAAEMESIEQVTIERRVIHVRRDSSTPNLTDAIPTAYARQNTARKYWTVPLFDARAVEEWADRHGLRVAQEVRDAARARWRDEMDAFLISNATSHDTPPEIVGLKSTLMGQQVVAVAAAERFQTVLIADEPGLGKTLESLAALRVAGKERLRAVVICPSSLTANWITETMTHFEFGTFNGFIAEGQKPGYIPGNADIVVVGWAIVQFWAETIAAWQPDALIIDEGHYGKSGAETFQKRRETKVDSRGRTRTTTKDVKTGGTQRGTGSMAISKAVTGRKGDDGMVLVLTGTPIVNRPIEVLALLEMLGIDDLFGGPVMFKERYCGPKDVFIGPGKGPRRDGYVRTYDGASNLAELNTRLRVSGHYLRRTKSIMVQQGDLPVKYVDGAEFYDREAERRPWYITPAPEDMAAYRQVEEETSAFFADQARDIAEKLKVDLLNAKVGEKLSKEAAAHLSRIAHLRQAAARAKVPSILAKVNELVARGEKVVIAAHHRDVVDIYADAFSGLRIQGGMKIEEVERDKKLFNGAPVSEHPVITVSIEAGKTGHTLCKQSIEGAGPACAWMILAEQIWGAGDEEQMTDRIYRIGQDRDVHIVNAVLSDSIDVGIYRSREKKRRIMLAAVDAVEGDVEKDGNRGITTTLARQGIERGLTERAAA